MLQVELTSSKSSLEDLSEAYKNELASVNASLEAANAASEASAEKVTSLEQYVERLTSEFDELSAECSRLESELEAEKEARSKIEEELQNTNGKLSETLSKLDSLQEVLFIRLTIPLNLCSNRLLIQRQKLSRKSSWK